MRWLRRDCLRLRRLSRADLPALEWLAGLRDARSRVLEPWAPREQVASLAARHPQGQWVVERDHRLIGALLAQPAPAPVEVRHPWSRRSAELEANPDASGGWLAGRGAVWLAELGEAGAVAALADARKALVQQLGLAGTYSVVEAAGWPAWRGQMSPEAYIQQVHAGLGDERVSTYLRAGYLMRGFWQRDRALHVAMVWANRRR